MYTVSWKNMHLCGVNHCRGFDETKELGSWTTTLFK